MGKQKRFRFAQKYGITVVFVGSGIPQPYGQRSLLMGDQPDGEHTIDHYRHFSSPHD